MSFPKFTVDTHVFRELGELLVGRDSTALVELLKNAYDADATVVHVVGRNLADPEQGEIVVADNGHGMTPDTFIKSFLRIASRSKDQAVRWSPLYHRRYTGSKGIGRLAAHKLARVMEVSCIYRVPSEGIATRGFTATIDWTKIEAVEVLSEVPNDAVVLHNFKPETHRETGTTITLKRLRQAWTERERTRFVSEAQGTQSPPMLEKPLPKSLLAKPLLFSQIHTQSKGTLAADWKVELGGEFDVGDDYLAPAFSAASWILEIDARSSGVDVAIAPTLAYQREVPTSKRVQRTLSGYGKGGQNPSFQSRILIRDGDWNQGSEGAKAWRKAGMNGVRVYLEGFRVLPYGEPGNDWLSLDNSYARRSKSGLAKDLFDEEPEEKRAFLSVLPARQYLGGAFLTADRCEGLKMLVNREGFLPNDAFYYMQEVLTAGINIATVERSRAKLDKTEQRRDARLKSAASKGGAAESATGKLEQTIQDSRELIRHITTAVAQGDLRKALPLLERVDGVMSENRELIDDVRNEQSMTRVLASLGTATAGFIHEVNGLLAVARRIEETLENLANGTDRVGSRGVAGLKAIAGQALALRQGLERQAAYVSEFSSADARRRRSRQQLARILETVAAVYRVRAAERGISFDVVVPADLKSPPMFQAELTAVFSNLFSNAIKAAGENGRILVTGHLNPESTVVRIENTGSAVRPSDGEKWFRPFATTASDSDPALGRGMGLGLTITRRMLDEYGAKIAFVAPTEGFRAAIEVEFGS